MNDLMFIRKDLTALIHVKNGMKQELKTLEKTDIDIEILAEKIKKLESIVIDLIIEITDLQELENEKMETEKNG